MACRTESQTSEVQSKVNLRWMQICRQKITDGLLLAHPPSLKAPVSWKVNTFAGKFILCLDLAIHCFSGFSQGTQVKVSPQGPTSSFATLGFTAAVETAYFTDVSIFSWNSCVYHHPVICVTWAIHICDFHPYAWHHSMVRAHYKCITTNSLISEKSCLICVRWCPLFAPKIYKFTDRG